MDAYPFVDEKGNSLTTFGAILSNDGVYSNALMGANKLSLDNPISLVSEWTIEFYAKYEGLDSPLYIESYQGEITVIHANKYILARKNRNSLDSVLLFTSNINFSSYRYIQIIYTAGTLSVYCDSLLVGSITSNVTFTLGEICGDGGTSFGGDHSGMLIDDLRVTLAARPRIIPTQPFSTSLC